MSKKFKAYCPSCKLRSTKYPGDFLDAKCPRCGALLKRPRSREEKKLEGIHKEFDKYELQSIS